MKEYTSRRTKRLQDKLFESRQKDLKIQRKLLEDSRNGGKSLLSQIEIESENQKCSKKEIIVYTVELTVLLIGLVLVVFIFLAHKANVFNLLELELGLLSLLIITVFFSSFME
ncbi:hypothetical protein [Lactovum miscens]|uniref:Uncharacterized protein n=1 Tax=Lactovum miscens TaxID=190387 RepID=A0A841C7A6_9LACT|nr:hypothetical protein [Lactovum miscens]MBB5887618.1 hypothetical protein [Lactovum miscens]